MKKKFMTLHRSSDNSTILLNSECVIMAIDNEHKNTILITTDQFETKHTLYVNESVERVKTMLTEAGISTVLVHGYRTNAEILITTGNILTICETKRHNAANNRETTGSTITLKQDFIDGVGCNETYQKIMSQL